MHEKLRKAAIIMLAAVLAVSIFVVCTSAKEDNEAPLLSPGLAIIAARYEMVVSAPRGGEAVFSAEDFARAVGYEPERIVITSRPNSAVGQLTLGGIVIPEGQVLSAQNLDRMAFMPSALPAADSTSFTFRTVGGSYDYACTVRLTNGKNAAPTVDCATAAALTAKVPEGGVCGGTLAANDPEGDALVFEITEFPRHGSVVLADRATGRYVYRPIAGYTGKDSFRYTVRDEWGNYSDEAEVRLTVSRFSTPDFADMSGSAETFARIVTAEGLMSGTLVGGESRFYPQREVTRGEFTVNLLLAAGYVAEGLPENTVFADDGDITASARPFIAKAYELGLTDGWIVDGKQVFAPDEAISVAEAARMTARLLGLEVAVEVSVPTGEAGWAKNEIAALCSAGFSIDRTGLSSSTVLDRAAAAKLLCGVLKIAEAKR
ncbi:MAG: Ig-like domain-containing protein [Eubacteriales bacterium]